MPDTPDPLHDKFDVYFKYGDSSEVLKLEGITWQMAIKSVRMVMEEGVVDYIFRVQTP